MKIDWSPLTSELSLWRHDNLHLPLWWRDDDAVANTPALDRLTRIAQDIGLPVHIAVIPDLLEPSLPPVFENTPFLIPVVHGWRHISHAPQGAKNAEFGHARPDAAVELRAGIDRLQLAFGAQLLPMFVPPWNRIDPAYLPVLADAGYRAVSTYGPRTRPMASNWLNQINTHIDPIFWRGDRGLVPTDKLISGIVDTLRDRRTSRTDITEPLGLLTHHLVHTEAIWSFSHDICRVLLDGGAVPADLRAPLSGAQP